MPSNIKITIATEKDIPGIVALHQTNLVVNLTEVEKQGGFVTTALTVAQIQTVIQQQGVFIAKDDNSIIGFIIAADWEFFKQWPIFEYMIQLFPSFSFKNFEITTTNSFQYGPICIDKNYRGQGIITELFDYMRIQMMEKYPLSLTFINKINIPSYKAHAEKLCWEVIDEFHYNSNVYYVLAYEMSKPNKLV
ncbi:GNAT family N-acetyltransferase [Flavobacterium sp.]|uniref:GNAT family N-acetyltransferase n=1 Tax=Flavobacterium sp. TaxID=239 RepID=UPI0022CB6E23|nr:GNAT family N-acetyltransferase [Flavobacterium sp.]MCZ8227711.1 GNAT family acetyltransferase [Flavobacterium sp.]